MQQTRSHVRGWWKRTVLRTPIRMTDVAESYGQAQGNAYVERQVCRHTSALIWHQRPRVTRVRARKGSNTNASFKAWDSRLWLLRSGRASVYWGIRNFGSDMEKSGTRMLSKVSWVPNSTQNFKRIFCSRITERLLLSEWHQKVSTQVPYPVVLRANHTLPTECHNYGKAKKLYQVRSLFGQVKTSWI